MSSASARPAEEGDLPRLTEIYNHYIVHTPITFDVEPYSVEQRRVWLAQYGASGRHRLLVAEQAGRVVGYADSRRYRDRRAYDSSIETGIYLDPGACSRGVGTALYHALFEALAGEDVHRAYAAITLPNAISVALHRRFGFEPLGVMSEAGRKLGRYWDVGWFEKRMGPDPGGSGPMRGRC